MLANLKHCSSLKSTNNDLWQLLEEKSQWINVVPVIKKAKIKKMVTCRGVELGLSLRNILKQVQFVPKHAEHSEPTKTFDK